MRGFLEEGSGFFLMVFIESRMGVGFDVQAKPSG